MDSQIIWEIFTLIIAKNETNLSENGTQTNFKCDEPL